MENLFAFCATILVSICVSSIVVKCLYAVQWLICAIGIDKFHVLLDYYKKGVLVG